MAYSAKRKLAEKIQIQFIEADMDIGFGLVDEAKALRASGQLESCLRVLNDAEEIVADIERRLEQLGATESEAFYPLLFELRNEITEVARE